MAVHYWFLSFDYVILSFYLGILVFFRIYSGEGGL